MPVHPAYLNLMIPKTLNGLYFLILISLYDILQRVVAHNQFLSININNATTETGVDFTVKLGTVTGEVPTNLKFYKDNTYASTSEITPGTGTITGQVAALDGTGVDVTIYWQWVYETGTVTDGIATGDAADTLDGEAAASLTIPITITGVQTPPSATAITSHID